jgi:hypothetical protein
MWTSVVCCGCFETGSHYVAQTGFEPRVSSNSTMSHLSFPSAGIANMYQQAWQHVCNSSGHIFKMKLPGYVKTMFNLLRSCWTIFHSNCTILYHDGIPALPHPHQHLLMPIFVIVAILWV